MIRNNPNNNISFNGRLNVFSINPKTRQIETTMISTNSIIDVTSSKIDNEQINTLYYLSKNGLGECNSVSLGSPLGIEKLKSYIAEQCTKANKTGNTIDILL